MKRVLVLAALLFCCPLLRAQSYVQNKTQDAANPIVQFTTQNTGTGNTIIAFKGCNTIYETCPDQTPTDSEGNLFTKIDECTAATVSDSAVKQQVYYATNIVGGTMDTVTFCPGAGCSGGTFAAIMELSSAKYLDQHLCGTGAIAMGGGSGTSGNITTTIATEILIGAGTNNFGGWSSHGTGWTDSFGAASQIGEYQTVSATSTYAATANGSGASDSTYCLEILAFAANAPASGGSKLLGPAVLRGPNKL